MDKASGELHTMDVSVRLFVEWTDFIETEGGTLEDRLYEYRGLLGEMGMYELGAELQRYHELETMSNWKHDEMRHASCSHTCSRCKVLLLEYASDK